MVSIHIRKTMYLKSQSTCLSLYCGRLSYHLQYFNSYFLYNVTLFYFYVINVLTFLILLLIHV